MLSHIFLPSTFLLFPIFWTYFESCLHNSDGNQQGTGHGPRGNAQGNGLKSRQRFFQIEGVFQPMQRRKIQTDARNHSGYRLQINISYVVIKVKSTFNLLIFIQSDVLPASCPSRVRRYSPSERCAPPCPAFHFLTLY